MNIEFLMSIFKNVNQRQRDSAIYVHHTVGCHLLFVAASNRHGVETVVESCHAIVWYGRVLVFPLCSLNNCTLGRSRDTCSKPKSTQ